MKFKKLFNVNPKNTKAADALIKEKGLSEAELTLLVTTYSLPSAEFAKLNAIKPYNLQMLMGIVQRLNSDVEEANKGLDRLSKRIK